MKVLLTGANGYIGTRLIPALLEKGHEVICLVRDRRRFCESNSFSDKVTLITGDLLKEQTIEAFPQDIDAAYYLVHTVNGYREFSQLEALAAHHFIQALNKTSCRQVIFLDGMAGDGSSKHLMSRQHIENILCRGKAALTILRSAIIIGRGNVVFDAMCNLVEKLPVIIVPGWIKTRLQPIALCDVLGYLEDVLLNEKAYHQIFDIGGPDVLSFKDMMLIYAKTRKLNRKIITIPFLPVKIASYLHFVTSSSYALALNLLKTIKSGAVCRDNRINDIVPRQCVTYETALELALVKPEPSTKKRLPVQQS
jgi:uncharacterized protein YbjT (DUF2867 family)